ncbi:MAG TPA: hypothetical protein PKA20_05945 [Burkholderiaceae bacterium]|nr:hypothetical protein [Burkholderiaceae bacterium]
MTGMDGHDPAQADLGWYIGAPPLALEPDALSPRRMRERFSDMRATCPTLRVWAPAARTLARPAPSPIRRRCRPIVHWRGI